jgi:hypothetical protein
MKALKVLVLFMAIILVVGFGFLIWGLSGAGRSTSNHAAPELAKSGPAAPTLEYGMVKVELPPGGKVDQILSVRDKIVVRVVGMGHEQLLVLDAASGHLVGGFDLEPAH